VDEAVIRSDPNRTLIPEFIVGAVCHVPYCAHPSYTQGYYDRDNPFYLEWDHISESPEGLRAYLDEWVYSLPDRAAYWQKLGTEVHQRLQVPSRPAAVVDYGDY
jgi:glutaconate CoA-transferase subunit A